jgi:hypothetical protein
MKRNNIVRAILTSLAIILFAVMAMGSKNFSEGTKKWDKKAEEYEEYCEYINNMITGCTGTCLTREEMAQQVYNFEIVQRNDVFDLLLDTPGEHEHDEKTRYKITTLGTNSDGVYLGIKVEVMDDTSACKIEEPEPQQTEETAQEEAGLPVKEIVGTYDYISKFEIKDHDTGEVVSSTEFTFKFTVDALEGNEIAIKMEGYRFGEGVYDPETGICDVKAAPEFFEAMHAEPEDKTARFTFSKKDGQVQFERIWLETEGANPEIGIKVE